MKFLVLALGLAMSWTSEARQLTAEEKMLDFQQLIGQIQSSYGPLQYKQQVLNIDINALKTRYEKDILASQTDAEFEDLIIRFVAEFRDSHFSARRPSQKRAVIPFLVDIVDGKVLVSDVDAKKMPTDQYGIERGDEIVTFDDRPIMDVIQELALRRGDGYAATNLRIASMYLTIRSGSVYSLPEGKANFEVISRKTQKKTLHEIPWEISGTDFDSRIASGPLLQSKGLSYDNLSMIGNLRQDLGPAFERTFMCSGGTRVEIPKDATMISHQPFVSYYYPTEKGNVGYLRIPHYIPGALTQPTTPQKAFEQYEFVVRELEKNTLGLIIDQDHNCGGSVGYLHQLLSLFVQSPVQETRFRLVANRENLISLKSEIDKMDPLTIAHKQALKIFDLLRTSYFAGEFLTAPTSITLNEWVHPHTIRYSKPIIVLIDELSASGGDAFPALMQGYGRALLLGTRTTGAGGHVTSMPALNFSQIQVSMTRSLFYRPDGVEIENNGAVPNIPYKITIDDFINGYKGYREFYTKKLLELL